jgi:hypothetical protein
MSRVEPCFSPVVRDGKNGGASPSGRPNLHDAQSKTPGVATGGFVVSLDASQLWQNRLLNAQDGEIAILAVEGVRTSRTGTCTGESGDA